MKKKLLISLVLVCLTVLAVGLVSASALTYEDLTYTVTADGDVRIMDCNTSATTVVIPSEIDGYPVTMIANRAFYGCSSLTSINIPEGVTSIGTNAFYNCSSLKSITIPEGVTSIGNFTFFGCSNLESVSLPSILTSIGDYAFRNCSKLKSITIPEGVTSIGASAFSGCSSACRTQSLHFGGHKGTAAKQVGVCGNSGFL